MYSFGPGSLAVKETLTPNLQKVSEEVIKIIDVSLLYGHRSNDLQLELWAKGRTLKEGGDKLKKEDWFIFDISQVVTKAFPGESKHNQGPPAPAMDMAPYPISYENRWKKVARFYFMAGIVLGVAYRLGIKLRWGGDWDRDNDFEDQTFDDLAHFEEVIE